MLDERGWTRDQGELDRLRLLEWIATNPGDPFAKVADLPFGHEDDALKADTGSLEDAGLIDISRGIASIRAESAFLTDHGRAYLRDLKSRRAERVRRVEAARDALLDWYWDEKQGGEEFPGRVIPADNSRAYFYGEPFTEREQEAALADLVKRGFLNGPTRADGSVDYAYITAKGEDVVEQFGSSTRASSQGSGRSTSTEFSTHFYGDVHGAIAIQGNATQTNNTGVPLEALVVALDAVRDAAADLGDEDRARVLTYVDLLHAEAGMDEPDREFVDKGLSRLKSLAAKTGNAALNSSIGQVAVAIASAL